MNRSPLQNECRDDISAAIPIPKKKNSAVQDWHVYLWGEFSFRPRTEIADALERRGAVVAASFSESSTHIIVGSRNWEKAIAELENPDNVPIIRERAAWAIIRGDFDDVSFAGKGSPMRPCPKEEETSTPKEVVHSPQKDIVPLTEQNSFGVQEANHPSPQDFAASEKAENQQDAASQDSKYMRAIASTGKVKDAIGEASKESQGESERTEESTDGKGSVILGENERILRTKLLTAMRALHDEGGGETAKFSLGEVEIELSEACVEEFLLPSWNQMLMQALDGCTAEGKLYRIEYEYSLYPAHASEKAASAKETESTSLSDPTAAGTLGEASLPAVSPTRRPPSIDEVTGVQMEIDLDPGANKSPVRAASHSPIGAAPINHEYEPYFARSVDFEPEYRKNSTFESQYHDKCDGLPKERAPTTTDGEEGIWIGLVEIAKGVSRLGRNVCVGCGETIDKMQVEVCVKDDSLHHMARTLDKTRKKRVEVLHEQCMQLAETNLRNRFKDKWKKLLAFPHLDDDDDVHMELMNRNSAEPNAALHSPPPARHRTLGPILRRGGVPSREDDAENNSPARPSLLGSASPIRRPALRPIMKRRRPPCLPPGPKRRPPLGQGLSSGSKILSLLGARRSGVGLQRPQAGPSGGAKETRRVPQRPVAFAAISSPVAAVDEDEEGDWRGLKRVSEKMSKRGMQGCCVCKRKIPEGEIEIRMREDSMFHMVNYFQKEYKKIPMRGKKDVYMHEDCADEAERICESQFHRDWKALYRKYILPQKLEEENGGSETWCSTPIPG